MTEMEQVVQRLDALEQLVKQLTDSLAVALSELGKARNGGNGHPSFSPTTDDGRPIISTDHPLIIRIEGVRGGAPITRFAGVSVHAIIGWIRIGQTPEQIREGYPHLSIAELCEALSYYLHHTAEIDGILAESEAAYARAPELSRLAAERKKAEAKT